MDGKRRVSALRVCGPRACWPGAWPVAQPAALQPSSDDAPTHLGLLLGLEPSPLLLVHALAGLGVAQVLADLSQTTDGVRCIRQARRRVNYNPVAQPAGSTQPSTGSRLQPARTSLRRSCTSPCQLLVRLQQVKRGTAGALYVHARALTSAVARATHRTRRAPTSAAAHLRASTSC